VGIHYIQNSYNKCPLSIAKYKIQNKPYTDISDSRAQNWFVRFFSYWHLASYFQSWLSHQHYTPQKHSKHCFGEQ